MYCLIDDDELFEENNNIQTSVTVLKKNFIVNPSTIKHF